MFTIQQRLDQLTDHISRGSFITEKRLGGEISFYIFEYQPQDELLIRGYVNNLLKNNNFEGSPLRIAPIDLYTLMLDILEEEKVKGKPILEMVQDIEEHDGILRLESGLKALLVPEKFIRIIEDRAIHKNLVIITGVGKVWPIIRSHNILNNLHHVLDAVPVLMFYPGSYDQKELRLFNLFKDDNYYRAFRIVENDR